MLFITNGMRYFMIQNIKKYFFRLMYLPFSTHLMKI